MNFNLPYFLLITITCFTFSCKQQSKLNTSENKINNNIQEPDKRGYIVKVGDKAPDFEMEFTNGRKAKLSDFKGKPIMLQFTASWCGVCIKEMPHIENEIWKAYRNKGLIVFAIDRDEPIEKVKDLIKKTNITYPVALDPGAEIFAKFATKKSGVTRNVIIDKNGEIVFLTRLFDPVEFNAMKEKIKTIL